MRDGFKVIDADRHVLEPSDLFANYLPAKFRDRVGQHPTNLPTKDLTHFGFSCLRLTLEIRLR